METAAQPPADAGIHLLYEWTEPGDRERSRTAAVVSVVVHVAALVVLLLLPKGSGPAPPPEPVRHVTTLIEPLTVLTQKAPNTGKVTKEFNAAEVQPRPRLQVPPSPPPAPHAAPRPAPPPVPVPAPAPKQAVSTPLPEPPKLEASVPPPVKTEMPPLPVATPPPPKIQAEEKPKVMFEDPGAQPRISSGRGQVPIPGNSPVADAIRQAARTNGTGGTTVGDDTESGIGGLGGGGILAPGAPASQASNIQLLSNPLGVDFRPYLTQILAAVRRNWMNILPESVTKMGRRGKVAIQFSIARDGRVPKLVIAVTSGADPLDRAAVAGISASVPFPPLPTEFKGDRIVLQFNFAYNMPRQ